MPFIVWHLCSFHLLVDCMTRISKNVEEGSKNMFCLTPVGTSLVRIFNQVINMVQEDMASIPARVTYTISMLIAMELGRYALANR